MFSINKYFPILIISFGFSIVLVFLFGGLFETRIEYENFLRTHPFNNREKLTKKQWKKILPKKDRPDLAMEQNFLMTMDPATKSVPREKLFSAYEMSERMRSNSSRDYQWQEHGPNNVAGRTRAILFDPLDSDGKKVWAGGVAGGLWYTNDITEFPTVWNSVDQFWDNIAISAIACDYNNPGVMYVGTGEGWFNADAVGGAGIWKSEDGGISWVHLQNTVNDNFYNIQKIMVHPITSEIFVATSGYYGNSDGGIYVSDNGGNTWTLVLESAGSRSRAADIEITANGTIYASLGIFYTDGVYRSDNGRDWIKLNNGSNGFSSGSNSEFDRLEISISDADPSVVYVAGRSTAGGSDDIGVFLRSNDRGVSWENMTVPRDPNGTHFTRGQAWYDLILASDPQDANIIYAGGIDLYRSVNGGQSWVQLSHWYGGFGYQEVHADQHAIMIHPENSQKIIFGNDGGVYLSEDAGSNISSRNSGYNVTQFYSCAIHPETGNNYFLAGAQDNGTQQFNNTQGIINTYEVTGGDGAFCHISESNPMIQLTSYVYNNIYYSSNGGNGFQRVTYDNSGRFINPSDFDSESNILYSAKDEFSIKRTSINNGNISESEIAISLGSKASNIKVSPFSQNTIFIGTGAGRIFKINSSDQENPTIVDITDNSLPNGYISCIEFAESEDRIAVSFSNYGISSIWETVDGGSSWSNKEGNLPDIPVRWLLYNPNNGNEVIIATEVGVWVSQNFSEPSPNWNSSNSGLANVRVDMLQIRNTDNLIIAATHGRGLFSSDALQNVSLAEISLDNIQADVMSGGYSIENFSISNIGDEGSVLSYEISTLYSNRDATDVEIISYFGDWIVDNSVTSWPCPDVNGIIEWGTRFTAVENIGLLHGVEFNWWDYYGYPNITIFVYDLDDSGNPLQQIGSINVPVENINTNSNWTYVSLEELNLSFNSGDSFLISYRVENGNSENGLDILVDNGGQNEFRSYGKFNENWNSLNGFFALDNEFLIRAHVEYSSNPGGMWLSVDPTSGNIISGGSEDINVIMNATEILTEGSYDASIFIVSGTGLIDTVDVRMNVSNSALNNDLDTNPKTFSLFPNFPNPFNLSTTIKYEIDRLTYVELKIFNIKGEIVKVLAKENQFPGIHSFIWDGKNYAGEEVPSGAYFLTISAGKHSKTSKMLLIK